MENDFFQRVFQVVEQVPHGRVTSYGAIAKFLGAARSSRMVGWAMNAAHSAENNVPAHRVVNRNGDLTGKGHFPTPTLMEEMLRAEGIEVQDDRVKDFKTLFWDPVVELDLEN